jgi:hypothetical protein
VTIVKLIINEGDLFLTVTNSPIVQKLAVASIKNVYFDFSEVRSVLIPYVL